MAVLPARGTPAWVLALWVLPVVAPNRWLRVGFAALAAGTLTFFRDPERAPGGPGFLAPADGLIREVSQRADGRWVVSTYLSLRDVHVTRAPEDGRVVEQQYQPGAHHAAFAGRSRHNERLSWQLDTAHGAMELVQYSGAVARRIVPYEQAGAAIGRGARIGLIRFGSRVDVILPAGVTPQVVVGSRVRAGTTPIAEAGVT